MMKDDLISRSALIAEIKRIGGQPFSEWDTMGVLALAERIPAVNAQTYLEQLELVKEAFDMAKSSLVPVMRCKDCKHMKMSGHFRWCTAWERIQTMGDEGFCCFGERRADDA